MHVAVKENIDWVGYVDYTSRDFHGYQTQRGSTYNAYLIRDQKTALVDTVKGPFVDRLLANVRELADLSQVNYLVCNHAEPDHSGGFPAVLEACPNAEVVCDAKCRETLGRHYDTAGWRFRLVQEGEILSLGKRTLAFVETPMVHWPESMITYVPEEKLLLSNDAFGQHLATSQRFDDQVPLHVIMEEAKIYFANIVMLYGQPIARAMEKAAALPIEMIAPSHGVIWRKHLGTILSAYKDWVALKPAAKVVILYDTMWHSTERMAQAIADGATRAGVEVVVLNLRVDHITRVATEVLDAACLAVGSPTLNGGLMPQVAAALTYLKGLKPHGKAALAFGAYGWSKGAAREIEEYFAAMKLRVLREAIQSNYVPSAETLQECRQAGKLLADTAVEMARAGAKG